MPNGWSGGFYLRRKQLETLLVNLGDRVEWGRTVRKPVTSSDCVEILNRWNDEQFLVEEHDHEWYVIQFPEPKDWIVVTNKARFSMACANITWNGAKNQKINEFNNGGVATQNRQLLVNAVIAEVRPFRWLYRFRDKSGVTNQPRLRNRS